MWLIMWLIIFIIFLIKLKINFILSWGQNDSVNFVVTQYHVNFFICVTLLLNQEKKWIRKSFILSHDKPVSGKDGLPLKDQNSLIVSYQSY